MKPTSQFSQNGKSTPQDTACNLGDLSKITHYTSCILLFYEGFFFFNSSLQRSSKSCFDTSEDMAHSDITLRKLSVIHIHSSL